MLQLLSPAGNSEAVIAAVQNGADMIYLGYGISSTEEPGASLSSRELAQCLRYCRVRSCPAAVVINDLLTEETLPLAVERAVYAAQNGAAAILLQDLGLASVLRRVLPDTPLWGGVRLNIHNTDGAMTAAALGFSRILLAPELTLEQIAGIAGAVPIEVAVTVHGPLCVSYSGQCHMSAMEDRTCSDSCSRCSEPCKKRLSLGGRMDERPLVMPDVCLIDHLRELADAGVACALIAGRSRRPEYVAYTTKLYARALREGALPTTEERRLLQSLFAPNGLSDGYLTGAPVRDGALPSDMTPRAREKALAELRRDYMNGEARRVPVRLYALLRRGQPAMFAAEDALGHRAAYQGYTPIDLGRQGITESHVQELLFRTGGTPYTCSGIRCIIDPDLDYADEAIEEARKALLASITEKNREPAPVSVLPLPEEPAPLPTPERTAVIFQVSREEQLTPELAGLTPDWLYVPAELLAAGCPGVDWFREKGTSIAAVLPPVVTDGEKPVLRELLTVLKQLGIGHVLVGNLSLLPEAVEMGMTVYGDIGLNIANRYAAQRLTRAGLAGITAFFQLSAARIAGLAAYAPTEMVVYGRMPVMITESCLIRASAGRCICSTPTGMSDDTGNVYMVEKAFGCRNTVYDGKKIFLADRRDVYENIGLRAYRLLFTTENAAECVDVAAAYMGRNSYRPNNTSRGVYPKGAL